MRTPLLGVRPHLQMLTFSERPHQSPIPGLGAGVLGILLSSHPGSRGSTGLPALSLGTVGTL